MLTAVVDLPTPPLPDAIATNFLTLLSTTILFFGLDFELSSETSLLLVIFALVSE